MLLIWVFDRVYSIKMARYWPSVDFFPCLWLIKILSCGGNPERERLLCLSITAQGVSYLGRSHTLVAEAIYKEKGRGARRGRGKIASGRIRWKSHCPSNAKPKYRN